MVRTMALVIGFLSLALVVWGQGVDLAAATPVVRSLRGEIGQVDIEKKTFTVVTTVRQQKKETPFTTDASTVFILDDQPATLVDLRRWMRVTVTPDSGAATRVVAKSLTPAELRKRKAQEQPGA